MYLLYQCPIITLLWRKLGKLCNYFSQVTPEFNLQMVILNNYQGPKSALVNTLILILKQYIYSQKCFKSNPTIAGFMAKLSDYYETEKLYAAELNRWPTFYRKWSGWF